MTDVALGPKLRVLIADDELLARKRLERLLSALEDIAIVGECASGDAVLARVREGGVDVVLLDVQMPGLSGIETLGLMDGEAPAVILCTAYSDYALEAFEGGAVDYVMKPVEPARLKKALTRARHAVRPKGAPSNGSREASTRLAIPTRDGIVLVSPNELAYASLEEQLVALVTIAGATYYSDLPLADFEDRLPPSFARVHRRSLLNLDHVTRLEPLDTGGLLAHTTGGHKVEVSRKAARELRRRLGIR
jgi:two-component system LytT family response regulator